MGTNRVALCLCAGALLLAALPARAGEAVGHEACAACGDCGNHGGWTVAGSCCVHRFCDWACYRPLAGSSQCCCCKRCAPCCPPALYLFFPCACNSKGVERVPACAECCDNGRRFHLLPWRNGCGGCATCAVH